MTICRVVGMTVTIMVTMTEQYVTQGAGSKQN